MPPDRKIPRFSWAWLQFLCRFFFLNRDVCLPWVFGVSNTGLVFACFKGETVLVGKSSVGARQGWRCTPAWPCSGKKGQTPQGKGQGGLASHEAPTSPVTYVMYVACGGCHGNHLYFPRQSTQMHAPHPLAHCKLLLSQGFSNLQRLLSRSCLKCY